MAFVRVVQQAQNHLHSLDQFLLVPDRLFLIIPSSSLNDFNCSRSDTTLYRQSVIIRSELAPPDNLLQLENFL